MEDIGTRVECKVRVGVEAASANGLSPRAPFRARDFRPTRTLHSSLLAPYCAILPSFQSWGTSEAKQDMGPAVAGSTSFEGQGTSASSELARKRKAERGPDQGPLLACGLSTHSPLALTTRGSVDRHVIMPMIGRALTLILHPHIRPDGRRRLGFVAERHDDPHRLILSDRGRRCHKCSLGQAGG